MKIRIESRKSAGLIVQVKNLCLTRTALSTDLVTRIAMIAQDLHSLS